MSKERIFHHTEAIKIHKTRLRSTFKNPKTKIYLLLLDLHFSILEQMTLPKTSGQ